MNELIKYEINPVGDHVRGRNIMPEYHTLWLQHLEAKKSAIFTARRKDSHWFDQFNQGNLLQHIKTNWRAPFNRNV